MLRLLEIFVNFPMFPWHACKLAKIGACKAKCMTTTHKIYIRLVFTTKGKVQYENKNIVITSSIAI